MLLAKLCGLQTGMNPVVGICVHPIQSAWEGSQGCLLDSSNKAIAWPMSYFYLHIEGCRYQTMFYRMKACGSPECQWQMTGLVIQYSTVHEMHVPLDTIAQHSDILMFWTSTSLHSEHRLILTAFLGRLNQLHTL